MFNRRLKNILDERLRTAHEFQDNLKRFDETIVWASTLNFELAKLLNKTAIVKSPPLLKNIARDHLDRIAQDLFETNVFRESKEMSLALIVKLQNQATFEEHAREDGFN